MAGKQAKTLSTVHIDDLLFFAERSRHPLRNRLVVLLSVKADLRAAEIAKLTWDSPCRGASVKTSQAKFCNMPQRAFIGTRSSRPYVLQYEPFAFRGIASTLTIVSA
jgi:hypothetical protein